MNVGRILFSPVSRVCYTTDPAVRAVTPVVNESAAAIVQIQKIVADLVERIERLESSNS